MDRAFKVWAGVSAALFLAAAPVSYSADQKDNTAMHMHKAEMDHSKSDAQVATEYQSEAQKLRAQAEHHRKLAQLYRSRTAVKGAGDFKAVAKHCDNLAKFYEQAATEAEAVTKELQKQ